MLLSKKINVFMLSLLCIFGTSQISAAKFYKWTDEDGNIHYSDKEPLGVESAEAVNISAPKTSETVNTIPAYKVETKTELSQEEKEKNEKQAQELKEYCNSLTTNIKTLQTGGRVKIADAEGNQKFLSDEEQQAKAKKYQSQYKERCASQN